MSLTVGKILLAINLISNFKFQLKVGVRVTKLGSVATRVVILNRFHVFSLAMIHIYVSTK